MPKCTDVGCEVPIETFVNKVKEQKLGLPLLSALLTATLPSGQDA